MKYGLPELPFYDVSGPLPIVHRGGDAAGLEKENSIAAFDSAWKTGIVYGETDTVATKDGVALAIHGSANKRIERKTGLPVRSVLESMTLDEVQDKVSIGDEPVPTLEELLITFPGMRFFIDPKTRNSVRPLAKLINGLKVHDRVSVGAFNFERTQAVADAAAEEARICTSVGVIGSLALLGNGISFAMAKRYIKHSGASQFSIPFNRVTSGMVDKAHDLGLRVILWTPNTEEAIRQSFDTGADGVMSDRTYLLKTMADARQII